MDNEEIVQTLGKLNLENDPKFKNKFLENMQKALEEHDRRMAEAEKKYGVLIDPETHVINWENLYNAYIGGAANELFGVGFTVENFQTACAFHLFTERGLIDQLGEVDIENAVKLGFTDECVALGVDPGVVDAWEIRLKGTEDASTN